MPFRGSEWAADSPGGRLRPGRSIGRYNCGGVTEAESASLRSECRRVCGCGHFPVRFAVGRVVGRVPRVDFGWRVGGAERKRGRVGWGRVVHGRCYSGGNRRRRYANVCRGRGPGFCRRRGTWWCSGGCGGGPTAGWTCPRRRGSTAGRPGSAWGRGSGVAGWAVTPRGFAGRPMLSGVWRGFRSVPSVCGRSWRGRGNAGRDGVRRGG
jgi:hypothetical protein